MKKAVELGKCIGFKFDSGEEQFSHLQYGNDIIIIGKKGRGNIWFTKANLMLF
jgi:hypothetical protein